MRKTRGKEKEGERKRERESERERREKERESERKREKAHETYENTDQCTQNNKLYIRVWRGCQLFHQLGLGKK